MAKKIGSLCMVFVLVFALVAPVVADTTGDRMVISLVIDYNPSARDFYDLHNDEWRVYVNAEFAGHMNVWRHTSRAGSARHIELHYVCASIMPTAELVIVRQHEVLGPFAFTLELNWSGTTLTYSWRSELDLEEAIASASDPVPDPASRPDPPSSTTNGVIINGTPLPLDVPPTNINGRLLAPLRAIGEALGAEFDWDGDTQTITMVRENTTVVMQIGNPEAIVTVNETESSHTLDAPPMIEEGRTLVPLRFIGEIFGAEVRWEAPNAIITTN